MKQSRLHKQFPELSSKLKEHNIVFDQNILTKSFDLDEGVHYNIRIPFKPSNKQINRLVQSAESKLHSRLQTIKKIYREAIEHYPLINKEDILEILKSIEFHNTPPNKLEKQLKYKLESLSIQREKTIYENVNDYPDIFPKARQRKRKIIAYLGETNSGKTYNAMSEIANSFQSAYLAPLRLLALENYEYLNSQGIPTNLITGEEKILLDEYMCTSCTVECFNFEKNYETVVIDEIQMIDDSDRGAFFIQALVGANADKIIVTGPPEYEKRLRDVAAYLDEEIEVKVFERKSKLKPIKKPQNLKNVKKNSAIVVFSRKDIFKIRKELPKNVKSSVVYGALGYEVRKMQAERYINGETDVLITTDAIGMGLNLPIENIIFTTHKKFNGKTVTKLSHMLTKQIAGRAGRFGQFDVGYFGAIDDESLMHIKSCMKNPLPLPNNNFSVLPTTDYIEKMMETYKLSTILEDWSTNHRFSEDSIFEHCDMTEKIKIAKYLEKRYPEKIAEYYKLINCPIDFEKDYSIFNYIVKQMFEQGRFRLPRIEPKMCSISNLEISIKEFTILLWFSNQFPEFCEEGYQKFKNSVKSIIEETNEVLHKKLSK